MQRRAMLERDPQTHDKLVPVEADPSPNGGLRRHSLEHFPAHASSSQLPIDLITLRKRHDGYGLSCPWCGADTQEIYVPHERWSKDKIVRAQEAPVYKCEECDAETPKLDAVVEFLTKVLHRIAPYDRATADFIREELAAARRQQRLVKNSASR